MVYAVVTQIQTSQLFQQPYFLWKCDQCVVLELFLGSNRLQLGCAVENMNRTMVGNFLLDLMCLF